MGDVKKAVSSEDLSKAKETIKKDREYRSYKLMEDYKKLTEKYKCELAPFQRATPNGSVLEMAFKFHE